MTTDNVVTNLIGSHNLGNPHTNNSRPGANNNRELIYSDTTGKYMKYSPLILKAILFDIYININMAYKQAPTLQKTEDFDCLLKAIKRTTDA